MFTKLPRLTYLARKLREDQSNRDVARKAVKLAGELLEMDWKVSAQRFQLCIHYAT